MWTTYIYARGGGCVKDKVSLVQLATISDESINSSVTLKAAQYIYHTSSVYTIYAS